MVWYTQGVRSPRLTKERLALYQELGDRSGVAEVLSTLAARAFHRGDLVEAKQRYEETLALFRALGDRWHIANVYEALGDVARVSGELDEAEHLYREAVKIQREIRDPGGIRWAQAHLGESLRLAGRFAEARRLREENLTAFGYLGDIHVAGERGGLGFVEMHDGNYDRARAEGEASLVLDRRACYRWGIAMSLCLLSCVTLAEAENLLDAGAPPGKAQGGEVRKRYAEALRMAQESVTIAREIDWKYRVAGVLPVLGLAARGVGRLDKAQQHLCEALSICAEIGHFEPSIFALPTVALLLVDASEHERAVEMYALASRYPYVANSRWFEDVFGRRIDAVAATLSPAVAEASHERGRARDLEATVEELLVELERWQIPPSDSPEKDS